MAGVGAARADRVPILASVHRMVTGVPEAKQAACILLFPSWASPLPLPVFRPSYSFFLFYSKNGSIPGVITANGCKIFTRFHPRHIYMNLPITEMCAHFRNDVPT